MTEVKAICWSLYLWSETNIFYDDDRQKYTLPLFFLRSLAGNLTVRNLTVRKRWFLAELAVGAQTAVQDFLTLYKL